MLVVMAGRTQYDEVRWFVATQSPTMPEMMYLQLLWRATDLAAPSVALQYLAPNFFVLFRR